MGTFDSRTSDPAYGPLRQDACFQATLNTVHAYFVAQRDELDRMRAEGLVPDRSAVQ